MGTITKTEATRHFEYLYAEYSGRLYNYIYRISHGNSYLAEEITQVAFQKLWERKDAIADREAMSAYLFMTARNTFFNQCEHEAIENVYYNYVMRTTPTDNDFSTEHRIDEDFLMEYLTKLIDELPMMRQMVFKMSRMQHKSHKQIAEELNISPSTVATHIALALQHLREQMEKTYDVDPDGELR